MTDPELTRRAEQAYLGALLAARGRHGADPGQQTLLTPGDFTDPTRQAIFTVLTSQDGAGTVTRWLDRLRGLAERLLSPWARAAGAYMTRLPECCPDPANLDAYAAMIADASSHRAAQAPAQPARPSTAAQPARQAQPAAKAPVLDGAATWLSDAAAATPPRRRPISQAPAAAQPAAASPQARSAAAPPEAARLARAVRASLPKTPRPEAGSGNDQGRQARQAGSPAGNAGLAATEQPAPRGAQELERRLLATMLNDRAEAAAIARWMPAGAFTSAPLRDLYQLACQRLDNGQPVDPLIIAWDASQLPGRAPQDREALARLALQVGALDPAPPAADAQRRAVRADYILTRLAGPTWDTDAEQARQLIPPALSSPRHQHGERPAVPVTAAAAQVTAPDQAAGQAATPEQPDAAAQQAPAPAAAKSPAPAQPAAGQPVPAQPARPVQLPLRQPPAPAADRFAQRM